LPDYQKIIDLSDEEHYLMIALSHAETIMHPLDRLALLFLPERLPDQSRLHELPNIAQIAVIRAELQWSLDQIGSDILKTD